MKHALKEDRDTKIINHKHGNNIQSSDNFGFWKNVSRAGLSRCDFNNTLPGLVWKLLPLSYYVAQQNLERFIWKIVYLLTDNISWVQDKRTDVCIVKEVAEFPIETKHEPLNIGNAVSYQKHNA